MHKTTCTPLIEPRYKLIEHAPNNLKFQFDKTHPSSMGLSFQVNGCKNRPLNAGVATCKLRSEAQP